MRSAQKTWQGVRRCNALMLCEYTRTIHTVECKLYQVVAFRLHRKHKLKVLRDTSLTDSLVLYRYTYSMSSEHLQEGGAPMQLNGYGFNTPLLHQWKKQS